ncbi:amino acid permease [Clostridiales bacterium oral taxon 876 str. F0540]|nr:amino acid permease [Clostridiales bacterium oral taxon 876 str. F0540]
MEKNTHLKKELGLVVATALVVGNMVGSGIFMLPATLANSSGPGATMTAWLLTGIGSIFLALSFAKLGSKIPKTGGPYEFSKLAFGDFIGFMNAWLYWNASWIGNAAIITSIASYTGKLFPIIANNRLAAFLYTSAILWIFTLVNIMGVKKAGIAQTTTTIFKVLLFLMFIVLTAYHFNPNFITPVFPAGKGTETIPAAAAATLWAFTGFESASVTAGEIKNPERNVKLSTILGMGISVIIYMAISFFAMGAMPQEALAKSSSPIVDILGQYLGSGVTNIILIFSVLGIIGTAIGWIMSTARMSYAAGVDKVFPEVFSKIHTKYNTPHVSLIISSVLVNILLLMNYSKSLLSAFNFIILLATLAYLPVYASTAAAEIMLLVKCEGKLNVFKFIKASIVPLIGFAYSVWAIYGSGAETVMYGFLLILFGVPFYLYMKLKDSAKIKEIRNFDKAA